MRIRVLRISLALAIAGTSTIARPSGPTSATSQSSRPEIDRIFADWDRHDSPGCALGSSRTAGSRTPWLRHGVDLEHDVPITPERCSTRLGVEAVHCDDGGDRDAAGEARDRRSDPQVSAGTARLRDAIKIRHLLHHTSGLRDYNTLLSIAGRRDEDAWDNARCCDDGAAEEAELPPGDEYSLLEHRLHAARD